MLASTTSQTGSSHISNGGSSKLAPPELAHVTNNIVPLLTILRFHTQEAYKQLSRQIELLAHTRGRELDATRKRKLLAEIVSLRQDFVKIYALVKWAQRSKDVLRLIDVLNFLRSQEFCFDNLALGVGELGHFLGAKLPQADLLTAMEVLVKGRPQLASYHHLAQPQVSPQRVLQVLRDLNVALVARMALVDDIPQRMRRNYTVKDGRITFTLPHEFTVSVTAGNDAVVASAEDYAASPFFFIDFALLCGRGSDGLLVSYSTTADGATILPRNSREKLEISANHALLTRSLTGLYDVLHRYAAAFKIYVLARQVRQLAGNGKWRGHLQYKHSAFHVTVNYWCTHAQLRLWRSFVELGVDAHHAVVLRWFKNGRYHNHTLGPLAPGTPSTPGSASGSETCPPRHELSVDFVLSLVASKHAAQLVRKVYAAYTTAAGSEGVSRLGAHLLVLQLTPAHSTVFAIDPLTGHFYFTNPSPLEATAQNRINNSNSMNPVSLALALALPPRGLVTEREYVRSVVQHLVQLRTDTLSAMVRTRLVTMGWVASDAVKLSENESAKLGRVAVIQAQAQALSLPPLLGCKTAFFRSRAWPASWFLAAVASGARAETYWHVARLRSVKGEWVVQWSQPLTVGDVPPTTRDFYKALARTSSSAIIHHLLVEELHTRGVGHTRLEDARVLERLGLAAPQPDADTRTLVALHNDGKLLPVLAASSTLFLACLFALAGTPTELRLAVCGALNDPSPSAAQALRQLGIDVDTDTRLFRINHIVDLSHNSTSTSTSASAAADDSGSMLGPVFATLAKMHLLLAVLHQVSRSDLRVTSTAADALAVEVDPYYRPFTLRVDSANSRAFVLLVGDKEKPAVRLVVRLLNMELGQTRSALVGAFSYLKHAVPVFQTIDSIQLVMLLQSNVSVLPNNLRRLHFEPKFAALNHILLVFCLNSSLPAAPKKIIRDRIAFGISFKKDRFASSPRLLLKFSMKDNFNSQNMKFKKLFEVIFASANDIQKIAVARNLPFVKLYYDFVFDSSLLQPFMDRITTAFVDFINVPQQV